MTWSAEEDDEREEAETSAHEKGRFVCQEARRAKPCDGAEWNRREEDASDNHYDGCGNGQGPRPGHRLRNDHVPDHETHADGQHHSKIECPGKSLSRFLKRSTAVPIAHRGRSAPYRRSVNGFYRASRCAEQRVGDEAGRFLLSMRYPNGAQWRIIEIVVVSAAVIWVLASPPTDSHPMRLAIGVIVFGVMLLVRYLRPH